MIGNLRMGRFVSWLYRGGKMVRVRGGGETTSKSY